MKAGPWLLVGVLSALCACELVVDDGTRVLSDDEGGVADSSGSGEGATEGGTVDQATPETSTSASETSSQSCPCPAQQMGCQQTCDAAQSMCKSGCHGGGQGCPDACNMANSDCKANCSRQCAMCLVQSGCDPSSVCPS